MRFPKISLSISLGGVGLLALGGLLLVVDGEEQSSPGPRAYRPANAPPVLKMLVPGFAVRSLPIVLPNLVNLQYRHDGVLVALGYNGNIWLLRDSDGDGLEDKSVLFWEGKGKIVAPIGMDLAPVGTPHGDAVFLPARGR